MLLESTGAAAEHNGSWLGEFQLEDSHGGRSNFTLENLREYVEEVDRRRERAEEGWRVAVKEREETEEKLRILESTCKGKCFLVPSPGSHSVLTSSPSKTVKHLSVVLEGEERSS